MIVRLKALRPASLMIAFTCMMGTAEAAAQIPELGPGELDSLRRNAAGSDLAGELSDSVQDRPPVVPLGALLDQPVSRTEYNLGPGDVLTLSIFGFRSEIFTLPITPEGSIVIPTVGVAQVGGLNLESAEAEVARRVRRFYDDAEVNLSLSGIRSFKLFLVGDVPDAGMREATPISRVSELIVPENENGVIHRNVIVRRANGQTLDVDLARFMQMGDLTHNPTVRAGDIIHVPTVDATVTITGQVAFSGVYEHRTTESLSDLLELANGGGAFRSDAADSLRLMRYTDAMDAEILTIALSDATGALGEQMSLEPFDALFIPRLSHYREHTTATIEGEVRLPGAYPIRPNETTVRELIEMAGGFTTNASIIDAVLKRSPVNRPRRILQLDSIPPDLLSRSDRRFLEATRRSDEGHVVIDFAALFEDSGNALDIALLHEDSLHVPEHRNQISVAGAVLDPGIVAFEPGQSLDYFIERAGGPIRRADLSEITVIKGRFGNPQHRNEIQQIDAGDRIIVPFKPDLTALERIQTFQGVMSAVSGVILTVVAVERLLGSFGN